METLTPEEVQEATDGRYRVLKLIGQGGMGSVYLAVHRELGSKVAIKTLPPEVRLNADRLERFRREAKLSAELSHPNLVPVFELRVKEDVAYLVMPYIGGNTLAAFLEERGRMRFEEVRRLLEDIGGALSFAHERGVVHRDVKPSNLMRESHTGRWLVTDFGVAHISAEELTSLTHSDATSGTLAYMAPEALGSAKEVDGRSDLFSLAVVAFECLTGVLPERDGPSRTSQALVQLAPDISPQLATALTKPLATARDERPDSIDAWLRDVDAAVAAERRPKLAVAVAVGLAVVAAILGGLFGVRSMLEDRAALGPPIVAVLPFDVEGSVAGFPLDSALPQFFAWQLRAFPDFRVLEESAVRTEIVRGFVNRRPTVEEMLAKAEDMGAHRALSGTATVNGTEVSIRVELHDTGSRRLRRAHDASGPVENLQALIQEIVLATFVVELAEERLGEAVSLPVGLDAAREYFHADRAFRRGAFADAIDHLDNVIALDSTYAPAFLKRTVATLLETRPTQARGEFTSALDAAERYRDRLDPLSQRMLAGYRTLVHDGNLPAAERIFRSIKDANPEFLDAWFLLGLVQLKFPLLGTSIIEARGNLNEVVHRDPSYGVANLFLIQAALALGNDPRGVKRYIREYRAVDSTSDRAELVMLVDSLLERQDRAIEIFPTFPARPPEVLENMAVAAGEWNPPAGGRATGREALRILWQRAEAPEELAVMFRMRMAVHLGDGQERLARDLLDGAMVRGVPEAEIDRWILIGAVTDMSPIADSQAVELAAGRLSTTENETLVSRWLVSRWGRRSRPAIVSSADAAFERAGAEPRWADSRLLRSLRLDLEALDTLAAGDSAAALDTWSRAMAYYDVADLHFGIVTTLWPLRADRARLAATMGRFDEVNDVAAGFERMAGFVDQVVWHSVFLARTQAALAGPDSSSANRFHDRLVVLGGSADGRSAALRDSMLALVDGGRPRP